MYAAARKACCSCDLLASVLTMHARAVEGRLSPIGVFSLFVRVCAGQGGVLVSGHLVSALPRREGERPRRASLFYGGGKKSSTESRRGIGGAVGSPLKNTANQATAEHTLPRNSYTTALQHQLCFCAALAHVPPRRANLGIKEPGKCFGSGHRSAGGRGTDGTLRWGRRWRPACARCARFWHLLRFTFPFPQI
jgi:hypothetical protein